MLIGFLPQLSVAKSNPQYRIIGGQETAKESWPFMTALVSKGSDAFNGQGCGASLIGSRYVLTASHCVEGTTAGQLDVVVGIHDLKKEDSQGQRVAVKNIIMHEDYSSPVELNNDIAILELESAVTGITPIKTMTASMMQSITAGTDLTVIGWGNRSTDGEDYPNILHQVNVPIYDRAQCEAAYPGLTEQMLCAGLAEGGKDSCQGDSGGPLVVNYNDDLYQVGVVSYGDGCAVAGKPGVYAKVSAFEPWLAQKTSGVSIPSTYQLGYVENDFEGEHIFTLSNNSESALMVGNAAFTEAVNVQNHNILVDECSGQSISIDASCSIKIGFQLIESGEASLSLSIESNNTMLETITSSLKLFGLEPVSYDANEAMDSNNVSWFTDSDTGWVNQSDQVSQGASALNSGNIGDAQKSVLLAVLDNAQKFSVDIKASTEQDYDFFELYIDGTKKFSNSGNMTTFETKEFELTDARHRVLFVYAKDAEVSEYDDKVYIDKFVVDTDNKTPIVEVDNEELNVTEGEDVSISAQASSDPDGDSLSFSWTQISGENIELETANQAILNFTAPQVQQDSSYGFKVVVSDNNGGTAETTVTVKVSNQAEAPIEIDVEEFENSSGGGSFEWWLMIVLMVLARKVAR